MADHLAALVDAGVSIWLDDLSRERLRSGTYDPAQHTLERLAATLASHRGQSA